jgi:hypothetical protein
MSTLVMSPSEPKPCATGVGLDVAVVVLARPHVAALPLECGGDHVVDEPVLVGQAGRLEVGLELRLEDLGEGVLEHAVVGLEDRCSSSTCTPGSRAEGRRRATPGEVLDGPLEVVHAEGDAAALGHAHDLELHRLATAVRCERDGDRYPGPGP